MHIPERAILLLTLLVVSLVACAPTTAPGARPGAEPGEQPRASSGRTLVIVARSEMPSLASKALQSFGLGSGSGVRFFNAGLSLIDGRGEAHPYLAESLPRLNSETWQVSPDGRMETLYRLRPNLTWHDGTPFSAEDFVFSWRVYATPELGHAASPPIGLIDDVAAPDPRTLIIRWRALYPDAGVLEASGVSNTPSFPALPRHILDEPFRQANWETLPTLPFWNVEFVGLGPFQLDRWDAGTFLEGVAFAGHALGRPKIDRIRVLFIPDSNTALANMLSGEAPLTVDSSLAFQQAMVLRREWTPREAGAVLLYPQYWRWITIQQRSEFANPRALTDVRVRKALSHSVDKQALNEALFEGEGVMSETPIPPTAASYTQVEHAAVLHPHDLRRTDQLMAEAGFVKGPDRTYASTDGARFSTDFVVFASAENETQLTVMAAAWRQAGFDIKEAVWAALVARDAPLRNTYPGLSGTGGPSGEGTMAQHNSAELPRPENRWTGTNRGGWSNPAFDRLATTFNSTLDRSERTRLLVAMTRIFTDDVAVIPLCFSLNVAAFTAALKGPIAPVPESDVAWNVHEWEFR